MAEPALATPGWRSKDAAISWAARIHRASGRQGSLLCQGQWVYGCPSHLGQECNMPSALRTSVTAGALLLALSASGGRADPIIYVTGGVGMDLLAIDAKTGETKVIGS